MKYCPCFALPTLAPGSIMKKSSSLMPFPGSGKTLYLAMEEQAEIGLRVTDLGELVFFSTLTGQPLQSTQISLPVDTTISSFALASENSRMFALGLSNGQALVFKHDYKSTYPEGKRVILPAISYPLGEEPWMSLQSPLISLPLPAAKAALP